MAQTVVTAESAARPARAPSLRPSIVLMVLGGLLALPCGLVATLHVLHAAKSGPEISVPGTSTVHLSEGPYMIYEATGSSHSYGPVGVSSDHGVTITPDAVAVTAPDGSDVRVREPGSTQTLNTDPTIYTGAVRFDAPVTGDYRVQIRDSAHTTAIIGRPISSAFGEVLGWVIAGGAGGLLLLAGLVLLTVTSIRRRRFEREHATAPAGWYPDPADASQWRYFDGATWSDHTHRSGGAG